MMKFLVPTAAALLAMGSLAGCTSAQVAGTNATLSQAESDANTAVLAYEAVLGIAEVAQQANPALKAKLQAIEIAAAPYVSQLQTLETDANADASTIEALVAQLATQESALMATSAPSIKATAS